MSKLFKWFVIIGIVLSLGLSIFSVVYQVHVTRVIANITQKHVVTFNYVSQYKYWDKYIDGVLSGPHTLYNPGNDYSFYTCKN
jgi:hypothetical protein